MTKSFDELLEYIQLYAQDPKASRVDVRSPLGLHGFIGLKHGDVVHAQTSLGQEGREAFYEIVSWGNGQILGRSLQQTPTSIDVSFSQLLLDTFWFLDNGDEHVTHPTQDIPPLDLNDLLVASRTSSKMAPQDQKANEFHTPHQLYMNSKLAQLHVKLSKEALDSWLLRDDGSGHFDHLLMGEPNKWRALVGNLLMDMHGLKKLGAWRQIVFFGPSDFLVILCDETLCSIQKHLNVHASHVLSQCTDVCASNS